MSALRHVALAALGFALACAAVRSVLPLPAASGLRLKVEAFERCKDEIDVLFIGSSHVMCTVIPRELETALAAQGIEARAFNLGVPGMIAFEADRILELVLGMNPGRLRLVVCEALEWRPDPRSTDPTDRNVFMHDPATTWTMLRGQWASDLDVPTQLARTLDHLRLCGMHALNVGALQRPLRAELGASLEEAVWLSAANIDAEQGYLALEEHPESGAAAGRDKFLADLEGFRRSIASMERRQDEASELLAYNLPALERRLEIARRHGVDLVHVAYAGEAAFEQVHVLARQGRMPELWAFNRPSEHPELYRIAARYDNRHLNRSGAQTFTAALAGMVSGRLAATADDGERP
jgi:hypothetical protein